MSSEELWMGFDVDERRSLMWIRTRVGESTEFWGTPAFIGKDFEKAPTYGRSVPIALCMLLVEQAVKTSRLSIRS